MAEKIIPPVQVCNSWENLIDSIKKESLRHDNIIIKSCDIPDKLLLGWVLCVPREDIDDGFWEAKFYGLPVFKMTEAPQELKEYMTSQNDGLGLPTSALTDYIELEIHK